MTQPTQRQRDAMEAGRQAVLDIPSAKGMAILLRDARSRSVRKRRQAEIDRAAVERKTA